MRAILWVAVSSEAQATEDKTSLQAQEQELRRIAAARDYAVTDVLVVPGFSRRYTSWDAFGRAAVKEGITAPLQMYEHWQRRDFDAVLVYDGSRFGRSQALFAYFVEETINAGAVLVTAHDGEISRNNYRMFISMSGYSAASDVDKFVSRAQYGKRRLAERGLLVKQNGSFTHILERGRNGKRERMVVDESKRRLFSDAVTVICGDDSNPPVAWLDVEIELFKRFGHAAENGKPYPQRTIYNAIRSPLFWGHTSYGLHSDKPRLHGSHFLWDESAPVPEGVELYRNTVPEVLHGAEKERLIAELQRRHTLKGTASPRETRIFSHLLICADCGATMTQMSKSSMVYAYYRCSARWRRPDVERFAKCENRAMVKVDDLRDYFNTILSRLIAGLAPDLFQVNAPPVADIESRITAIEREISAIEATLAGLFVQRATAPAIAQETLDRLIVQHADTLAAKKAALNSEHQRRILAEKHDTRTPAIAELREMTLAGFWQLPEVAQSKLLHRLMGTWRLRCMNGEILGFVDTANNTE